VRALALPARLVARRQVDLARRHGEALLGVAGRRDLVGDLVFGLTRALDPEVGRTGRGRQRDPEDRGPGGGIADDQHRHLALPGAWTLRARAERDQRDTAGNAGLGGQHRRAGTGRPAYGGEAGPGEGQPGQALQAAAPQQQRGISGMHLGE
jgi:hypothetical protein